MANDQPTTPEEPKPSDFPIFVMKKIYGYIVICIRKTDTENSSWHIVGNDGLNYGAWEKIETFVEAYKLYRHTKIMSTADRTAVNNGKDLVANPMGRVRLMLRHLESNDHR